MAAYEINIRKLRIPEARLKLEEELNRAFMSGQRDIQVIHGIGMFKLKELTASVVAELGLGRVLPDILEQNPGVTRVELLPPQKSEIKKYT